MKRTDIYLRFKFICQCLTAAKQQNEVRCFAVGREYEVNAANLMKGDIQSGSIVNPKYFYSRRWVEGGKVPSAVVADYPMCFLTAGDRTVVDRYNSRYEFDILIFDLMFQDRNNFNGNETALREKEDIWQDTEDIMIKIIDAWRVSDVTVYNDAYIASILGFASLVRAYWSVPETAAADAYYQEYLSVGVIQNTEPLMPFDYEHNNRLAGTATRIAITVGDDCLISSFAVPDCL